jgi:hypothetical protein
MDDRALLGRQLASITDTLAKASQRRDAEVKKRSTNPSVASTTHTPHSPPSSINLSLISHNEGTGSSDPGGIVVFRDNHTEPTKLAFERFDLNQKQANDIMGWIDSMPTKVQEPLTDNVTDDTAPRVFLRVGDGSSNSSDYEDPKEMLARLETKLTDGTYDKNNMTAPTSPLDRVDPITSSEEADDAKMMLAEMAPISRTNGVQDEEISDDSDPRRMLADFDSTLSACQNTIHGEVDAVDQHELLRGLQGRVSSIGEVIVDSNYDEGLKRVLEAIEDSISCASDNDPRRMLDEIEELTSCANENDPRRMLAELERRSSVASLSLLDVGGDDLEALRGRLTKMLSPSAEQVLPTTESQHVPLSNNHDGIEPVCDKALIPSVIALQLETAGVNSEEAQGWTEYLFGSGLNSHKKQQEKATVVAQAEKELDELIEYTLREEERYQRTENERRLPCRLIVSNIAADAAEEDLKEFFYHVRSTT